MGFETTDLSTWVDRELAGSRFSDARLGKRLLSLLYRLSALVGDPLPLACGDWASTKAAYRFLSNADVSEDKILAGHFAVTAERIRATEGPILVLQDTTERAIRGIAIGRRNWTFAGSDAGGRRAAAMYTLIETAKLNDIDPRAYLADVLARLPGHTAKQIAELLPWNWRKVTMPHAQAA